MFDIDQGFPYHILTFKKSETNYVIKKVKEYVKVRKDTDFYIKDRNREKQIKYNFKVMQFD